MPIDDRGELAHRTLDVRDEVDLLAGERTRQPLPHEPRCPPDRSDGRPHLDQDVVPERPAGHVV
jgi:hypothetical protein